MKKNIVFGMASVAFVWTIGTAFAAKPEELVEFPVSDNSRGHENVEWSTS